MNEPLTLFVDGYFANPYDATCYVSLVEKQLDFAIARALLRDGQGVPPALQWHTSLGRVPALRHGAFYLTESIAIAEYLDETFPPPTYAPLFPRDARARARVRQILAYVRIDLRALREERPWTTTLWPIATRELSPAALRDGRELVEFASHLLECGDLESWTIAHLDLSFALMRLPGPLPAPVAAFVERTNARPSVRAYLDHPRPPHPPP